MQEIPSGSIVNVHTSFLPDKIDKYNIHIPKVLMTHI